jgi:hypothetical protein
MTKIKTGSGLASYLDSVIQETVKSSLQQRALKEREKQDLTQGSKKSNNSSGNKYTTQKSCSERHGCHCQIQ